MYIFNHIPKTGGMSMYWLIRDLIGPDRLSPHFSLNEDTTYEVSPKDYEKYLVIYGHIGVVWNDAIGPNRQWMTMVRDPVDRVLSQYYYWRNSIPPSPHLPYVYAAQTLPLEEYLRSRDQKFLQGNQNVQTWQLADDFRIRYRKVAAADALEIAKHHLAERCAFVGIFEDYQASVERLCRLFGTPLPASIPLENRTHGRRAVSEISPDVIAVMRELNEMDQALYEFAKNLVRTRFRREARFETPNPSLVGLVG